MSESEIVVFKPMTKSEDDPVAEESLAPLGDYSDTTSTKAYTEHLRDTINDISLDQLNECMLVIQPGFIQQHAGTTLQADERDIFRAKILQEKLTTYSQNETTKKGKGEDLYDV